MCPKCKQEFNKSGKLCTPCYQKSYYEQNTERIRLRKVKYYENKDNKEKRIKQQRKWTELNKERKSLSNKVYYTNNKTNILSYQKKIRNTPKRKFSQGKKSALERDLEWKLTFDEYKDIICNSCHYCKTSLEGWGGMSLDRINNSAGYILTNVLPCCGTCNNMRNDFLTVEEMEVAMAAVLKLREKKTKQGETSGG